MSPSIAFPQLNLIPRPPLERVGVPTLSPTEIDTLARTIYGEARGESLLVQCAVAWVVCNRVSAARLKPGQYRWWGDSVAGVCLKRWQFSCWNEADPNLPRIRAARIGEPVFDRCYASALLVTGGSILDPTDQSTHYHDDSISMPGDWQAMTRTVRIGPMHFFREGSWS